MKPTIENVLASIPAWQMATIRYEPLGGGVTNDTYKVSVDDEAYVVRINGAQAQYLGLSRALEVQAVEQAHARGIAPRVFRYGDPDQVLVTAYLPGPRVTPEEAHTPGFMARLGELLRQVHAIQSVERYNDPFTMIERYVSAAERLGASRLEAFASHLRRLAEIARQYHDPFEKYCHNDIFVHNLLWDEGCLRAIDWELSGYGDVFFELASIAYSSHYTEVEERQLLAAYFGDCNDDLQHRLQTMRYVGLIREVAWAMLMAAIVENPVNHSMDYIAFQKYVLEQLDAGRLSA